MLITSSREGPEYGGGLKSKSGMVTPLKHLALPKKVSQSATGLDPVCLSSHCKAILRHARFIILARERVVSYEIENTSPPVRPRGN